MTQTTFPELPEGWSIDTDWTYNGTWYGTISRAAIGDEASGKFIDCEGITPYEAVKNAISDFYGEK